LRSWIRILESSIWTSMADSLRWVWGVIPG
jgi:hypothetical protein